MARSGRPGDAELEHYYALALRPKRAGASSPYKGVMYIQNVQGWRAQIRTPRKRLYIGTFETEEAAALAYNKAAREIIGEHAVINDIELRTYRRP